MSAMASETFIPHKAKTWGKAPSCTTANNVKKFKLLENLDKQSGLIEINCSFCQKQERSLFYWPNH